MRLSRRRFAELGGGLVCAAALGVGLVWVSWNGFGIQTTGDYRKDFAPAMSALLGGHLGAFFNQLPADGAGGSVLLRAPGAVLGKLFDGGQVTIFRFGALWSLMLLAVLALRLAGPVGERVRPPAHRVLIVGLCLLTPAALEAIFFGHPEEPLGAALCVAAVLLADADMPVLAGVSLGLAIINKPWGVLAIPPALLAARGGWRVLGGCAAAVAAAWFGAAFAVAPGHFAHSLSGLAIVAHPEELWWPLAALHSAPGITPAYFLPGLISDHARELVVVLALPLSLPLARRRARTGSDCLALLALLLLVRCMLDPSNHVYYHVPFVIAFVAWEARSARFPVLGLLALGGLWLVFHTISGVAGLDVQFAAYMAVTLPLLAVLAAVSCTRSDRHGSRQRLPLRAEAFS